MVKVKICGLTRQSDIEAVNAVNPEYIGFVFVVSRRKVSHAQAFELRKSLFPGIIPVGVFVDETAQNILSLVRNGVIEAIQLHGSEDESYIERLKLLTDVPVIKAIAVQNKGDVQKWERTAADYLLLDNKDNGTNSGVVIDRKSVV